MWLFDLFKKKKEGAVPAAVNPELKAQILRLASSSLILEEDSTGKILRPEASKIGGKPFLPADFSWPVFAQKDEGVERPLAFLCQVNLAEVPLPEGENRLPARGMLSFFYECESFCGGFDPEDEGGARVFYFEDLTDFVATALPEALDEAYRMPEIQLGFRRENSYPGFEEFCVLSDLDCTWNEYDAALESLGVDTQENSEKHKLLGYADLIQGEILSECEMVKRGLYCGDAESYQNTPKDELADIRRQAREWTLLLQLGTIAKDEFEWMFGDCGMIYYYIKKEDLAQKRFEKGWFSVQCC